MRKMHCPEGHEFDGGKYRELPVFKRSGLGRFDFRIPDGLGNYTLPDPDVRMEFYDAAGALRFTATVKSSPEILEGDDYDPVDCPEGGVFVAVRDIPLEDFSPGPVEVAVFARVEGVPVLPHPTKLPAFVVED